MCGIVGYRNKYTTEKDLEILKKVMIESRIRGKHASGIAWWNAGIIHSDVRPVPIDELVNSFDFSSIVFNGSISMIAHARYSTSDIRYNQPLVGKTLAVVHNGVITQSSPDSWKETYGYDVVTSNDSELLLRAIENGDNIFDKFEDSSIAMVALKNDGTLIYTRNGIRPLWMGKIGKGTVYASTFDILDRAGVSGISRISASDRKDLQRRNMKND